MNPPSSPGDSPGRSVVQRHAPSSPSVRRLGAGLALVGAIAVGSSCGVASRATPATTTTVPAVVTTTTLPTGTAADLLPALRSEASSLAGVMIDEGDDGAVLERIVALWEATRAEIGQQRPDLVPGFQQNIALAEKAVQFSRAADADKAAKNIDALVSAFLGE